MRKFSWFKLLRFSWCIHITCTAYVPDRQTLKHSEPVTAVIKVFSWHTWNVLFVNGHWCFVKFSPIERAWIWSLCSKSDSVFLCDWNVIDFFPWKVIQFILSFKSEEIYLDLTILIPVLVFVIQIFRVETLWKQIFCRWFLRGSVSTLLATCLIKQVISNFTCIEIKLACKSK